jgi:hypothetical protein
MGFFSWKTCDTKKSIWNMHTVRGAKKPVYMLMPNGQKPIGGLYDGYGRLVTPQGNVEIYEKLAEINGYTDDLFNKGLVISHGEIKAKYPLKLSFNPSAKYENFGASERCPNQGYWGAEGALASKEEILEERKYAQGTLIIQLIEAGDKYIVKAINKSKGQTLVKEFSFLPLAREFYNFQISLQDNFDKRN